MVAPRVAASCRRAAHWIASLHRTVPPPRLWPALLLPAVMLAPATVAAAAVRCEGGDGRIVYTEETCPPGTQMTRSVAPAPLPTPEDQRAAQARLKDDRQRVQQIERAQQAETERLARAEAKRAAVQARQERLCSQHRTRIARARGEFERAPLGRRDAAQRRLDAAQSTAAAAGCEP